MKHLKKLLFVLLASCLFVSQPITANAYNGVQVYQSASGNQTAHDIANGIQAQLNNAAPEIKNWCVSRDVFFSVVSLQEFLDIGDANINSQCMAFSYQGCKTIFYNAEHWRGALVSDCTHHEIGHLIDDATGASASAEFRQLYAPVAEQIRTWLTPVCLDSAAEQWAETFNMYAQAPQRLYNLSPGLYEYCQRIFPTTVNVQKNIPAPAPAPAPAPQVSTPVPAPQPEVKKEMPAGLTKDNFDYKRYADQYQDIKNAFGYDQEKLWNHYTKYGLNEGREAYIDPNPVTVIEAPAPVEEKQEETPVIEEKKEVVEQKEEIDLVPSVKGAVKEEEISASAPKVKENWGAHKKAAEPVKEEIKTVPVAEQVDQVTYEQIEEPEIQNVVTETKTTVKVSLWQLILFWIFFWIG